MGTEVPRWPNEILPATLYTVTVDHWLAIPGPARCGGIYQGQPSADFLGQVIIDWINADKECTFDYLIGWPLTNSTNRIVSVVEAQIMGDYNADAQCDVFRSQHIARNFNFLSDFPAMTDCWTLDPITGDRVCSFHDGTGRISCKVRYHIADVLNF